MKDNLGIYYAAIDVIEKKIIHPPEGYGCKTPSIYHPKNPFSGMVIMMNCRGYDFERMSLYPTHKIMNTMIFLKTVEG